jgi:hypothetical protein
MVSGYSVPRWHGKEFRDLSFISRMDRVINETIRTAIKMVWSCHVNGGLRNETHRGKGGVADQLIHGRMGLGTACKEEISRVKNDSIESSGGKNYVFELKKTVFTEEFLYIIYLCVCVCVCACVRVCVCVYIHH